MQSELSILTNHYAILCNIIARLIDVVGVEKINLTKNEIEILTQFQSKKTTQSTRKYDSLLSEYILF